MEIKDGKVWFTPSEAKWAQEKTIPSGIMPSLAQRILRARVDFARPWLAVEQVPMPIRDAKKDVRARVAFYDSLRMLHTVTLQHATDEQGREQPVIPLELHAPEKRVLLTLAQLQSGQAHERLETPMLAELREDWVRQDFMLFAAASDVMSPAEALAVGDMLGEPCVIAEHNQAQQAEARQNAAIAGGIIVALEAHLS